MAEQDAQSGGEERSHEPTPERLEEARRKGDVPRSADVAAAAGLIGLIVALAATGEGLVRAAGGALAGILGGADRLEGRLLGPGGDAIAAELARETLLPVAPLMLVPAAAALLAFAAQRAIVAAPDKIAPKLSRVSPLSNAKQKYGPAGLVEFLKATFKLLAVAGVLAAVLAAETDRVLALLALPGRAAAAEALDVGFALLPPVAAVFCAVAAADYAWQVAHHRKRLMMTRQEVKDEAKRSEGDPHLKQERRRRANSIATNRMLADVPKADVVVVNPEHYAVALAWSRAPGSAPTCVAKGVDEIARAIRERASEAGVPLRRDPPCARALHGTVEIGEEIRPEHYKAVAAAIRWAEEMRRLARERGTGP